MARVAQFLDYMATNPDAVIRFYASGMILNVHSDASYQTASIMRSRGGGYCFLGSLPTDNMPIKLNGNIHVISTVIKLVAPSAAEAELGALFLSAQQGKIICLILKEMGHTQPPTPIHIGDRTCVGIHSEQHTKTFKIKSHAWKIFWLLYIDAQNEFSFHQHLGQEFLGDFPLKARTGTIHKHVRPYYVHVGSSPRVLLQAAMPSSC